LVDDSKLLLKPELRGSDVFINRAEHGLDGYVDLLVGFEFVHNYFIDFGPFSFFELLVLLDVGIANGILALFELKVLPLLPIQILNH